MHTLVLIEHRVKKFRKIKNIKREKHRGETVETPEKVVETLGETYGNTMGNGGKWLGNWGNKTSTKSPCNNHAENETDRF